MPDPVKDPNSQATDTGAKTDVKDTEKSLLDGGDTTQKPEGDLLDAASKEAKEKAQAEEKRLLEAKDEDLSPEDKTKKETLLKAKKEADDKAKVDAEKNKVPEKYDIKLPEGIALDQANLDKVSPIFKELGLSNEKAQKLVDAYITIQKSQADTQEAAFQTFVKESKDETIKSLGANYKEQMAFAAKVKERFLSDSTMEKLRASGLANDKDLIMDLIKIGRLISEDKFEGGSRNKKGEGTPPHEVIYNK